MPTGMPQTPHVSRRHCGQRFGPIRHQQYAITNSRIKDTTPSEDILSLIGQSPRRDLKPSYFQADMHDTAIEMFKP